MTVFLPYKNMAEIKECDEQKVIIGFFFLDPDCNDQRHTYKKWELKMRERCHHLPKNLREFQQPITETEGKSQLTGSCISCVTSAVNVETFTNNSQLLAGVHIGSLQKNQYLSYSSLVIYVNGFPLVIFIIFPFPPAF